MELSLFAICLLIASGDLPVSTAIVIAGSEGEWEYWKAMHGKNYYSLSQEIVKRTIWWENNKKVEAHNVKHRATNDTFKLAMNHFGDWTALEFGQLLANQDFEDVSDKVNQMRNITGEEIGALPQDINWTSAGYVTKEHSTCNYNGFNKMTSISEFKILPFGNEAALAKAVAEIGPIAMVIDSSLASFQFYSSGIYYDTECKSNKFNHAILVVGYGVEGGQNYWNVKNRLFICATRNVPKFYL